MSSRKSKKNQKLGSSRRYKNRNKDIDENEYDDGFQEPGNEKHDSEDSQFSTVSKNQESNEPAQFDSDQPVIASTSKTPSELSPHPQSYESKNLTGQAEVTSKKRKMGSTRKSNRELKFGGNYEDEPELGGHLCVEVIKEQGETVEVSIKEDSGKEDQTSLSDCAPSQCAEHESSILQGEDLACGTTMHKEDDHNNDEHQHLETAIQSKPMDSSSSELNQSKEDEFGQDLIRTSLDLSIFTQTECNLPLQESDEFLKICHQMDTFTTDHKSSIDTTTPFDENREEGQDVQMSLNNLIHNDKPSMVEQNVLKTIDDQSSLNYRREDFTIDSCSAEEKHEVTEVQSVALIDEHKHGTQDDKVATDIWPNVITKASTEDENKDEDHLRKNDDSLNITKESSYKSKSRELREDTDEYNKVSVLKDRNDNDSNKGATTNLNQAPEPDSNISSPLKIEDQEVETLSDQFLSNEFKIQAETEIKYYKGEQHNVSEANTTSQISADMVDIHCGEKKKYKQTGIEKEVENEDVQSTTSSQLFSKVSSTNMSDFITESELISAERLNVETETSFQTHNLDHNNSGECPIELELKNRVCSDQMFDNEIKGESLLLNIETEVIKENNNDINEEINTDATESLTKEDFIRVDDEKTGISTFMNEHEMISVITNRQDYAFTDQAPMEVKAYGLESPDKGSAIVVPDQKENMSEECLVNPMNKESDAEPLENTFSTLTVNEAGMSQNDAVAENVKLSHFERKEIDSTLSSLSGLISDSFKAIDETISVLSLEEITFISEDATLSFPSETCHHQSSVSMNILEPEKIHENMVNQDENVTKDVAKNQNTNTLQEYIKTPLHITTEDVNTDQEHNILDRQDEVTVMIKNICRGVDTTYVLSDVAEHLVDIEVLKMQRGTDVAESIVQNEEAKSLDDPHQKSYSNFKLGQSNPSECTDIVRSINTDTLMAEPLDAAQDQINTVLLDEVNGVEGLIKLLKQNEQPIVNEEKEAESTQLNEQEMGPITTKIQNDDFTEHLSLAVKMQGNVSPNDDEVNAYTIHGPVELIPQTHTVSDMQMNTENIQIIGSDQNQNQSEKHQENFTKRDPDLDPCQSTSAQQYLLCEVSSINTDLGSSTIEKPSPATEHPDFKGVDKNGIENQGNTDVEMSMQKKRRKVGSTRRLQGRHQQTKEYEELEHTEKIVHQIITQAATSILLTDPQNTITEVSPTYDIHDSPMTMEPKETIKSKVQSETKVIDTPPAILRNTVVLNDVSSIEGLTDIKEENKTTGVNEEKDAASAILNMQEIAPIITKLQDNAFIEHVSLPVHGNESPDDEHASEVNIYTTCGPVELISQTHTMSDRQMNTENIHIVGSDQNHNISSGHLENLTNRESEPEPCDQTNTFQAIKEKENTQDQNIEQKHTNTRVTEEENNDSAGLSENVIKEDFTSISAQQNVFCEISCLTTGLRSIERPSSAGENPDFKEDNVNTTENVENENVENNIKTQNKKKKNFGSERKPHERQQPKTEGEDGEWKDPENPDFKEDNVNTTEDVGNTYAEIHMQTQTKKKKKFGSTRRPHGRQEPRAEGEVEEFKDSENTEEIEHHIITQGATSNLHTESQNISEVSCDIPDSTLPIEQKETIETKSEIGTGVINTPPAILLPGAELINTVVLNEGSSVSGVSMKEEAESTLLNEQEMLPIITTIQDHAFTEHVSLPVKLHGNERADDEYAREVRTSSTSGPVKLLPQTHSMSHIQINTENSHAFVSDQNQNISEEHLENLTNRESEPELCDQKNKFEEIQEKENIWEQNMDQKDAKIRVIEEKNNDAKEKINTCLTENVFTEDNTPVSAKQNVLSEVSSLTTDLGLTTIEHPSSTEENLDFNGDKANTTENVDNENVEIHMQTQSQKKKKFGSTRRPHGRQQPHAEGEDGEWKDPENTETEHQVITQAATSNLLTESHNTISEVSLDIHDSNLTMEPKEKTIKSEVEIDTGKTDTQPAILSPKANQINTVVLDDVSSIKGLTDVNEQNEKPGDNEDEHAESALLNEQEITPMITELHDDAFAAVKEHVSESHDDEHVSEVNAYTTCGPVELIPQTHSMSDLQMNTENIHVIVSDQTLNISEEHLENPTNRETEPEQYESTSPFVQTQEPKSSQVGVIKENVEFSSSEKKRKMGSTRRSLRGPGIDQKNKFQELKEIENLQEQNMEQKDTNTGVTQGDNNDTMGKINADFTENVIKEDITPVSAQQNALSEVSSLTTDLGFTAIEHASSAGENPDLKEDNVNTTENVENKNAEIHTQTQTKKKKKFGSTRRPHGRQQPETEGEDGEWKDPENTETEHQVITQAVSSNMLTDPHNTTSEVSLDNHDSTLTMEPKETIKSEVEIGTLVIDTSPAKLSPEANQINTVVLDDVSSIKGLTDVNEQNEKPGDNEDEHAESALLNEQEITPMITELHDDAFAAVKEHVSESHDDEHVSEVNAYTTCGPVELIPQTHSMLDLQMNTENIHVIVPDQNLNISDEYLENPTNKKPEQYESTSPFVQEDITPVSAQQNVLSEVSSLTTDLGFTTFEHPSSVKENPDYKKENVNTTENVDNENAEIHMQSQTKKKKKFGSTRRPHGRQQPHAEGEDGEWKDPENTETEHQVITQAATSNLLTESHNTFSEVSLDIHDSNLTMEPKEKTIKSEVEIDTGKTDTQPAILSPKANQINTVVLDDVSSIKGLTDVNEQNEKPGDNEDEHAESALLNEQEITPMIIELHDDAFAAVKEHVSESHDDEHVSEVNAYTTCGPVELIPQTHSMSDLQMNTENIHVIVSDQTLNISEEHLENPTNRETEPEQYESTSPFVQTQEPKSSQVGVIKENVEFSSSEKKRKMGSTRRSLRGPGIDQKNKFQELKEIENLQEQNMEQKDTNTGVTQGDNNDTMGKINADFTENVIKEDITPVSAQQNALSEVSSLTTDLGFTAIEHASSAGENPDLKEDNVNTTENVENKNAEIHTQTQTKKKKKFGSTRRPHGRQQPETEGEDGEWKDPENTETEHQVITQAVSSNMLTDPHNTTSEVSLDNHDSTLTMEPKETIKLEVEIGTLVIDTSPAILSPEANQINTVVLDDVSSIKGLTDVNEQNEKPGDNEDEHAESALLNEQEITPMITELHDDAFAAVKEHVSESHDDEHVSEVNAYTTCGPVELIPQTHSMLDLQMNTENIHVIVPDQNLNISDEYLENPTNKEPEQYESTSPFVQEDNTPVSAQQNVLSEVSSLTTDLGFTTFEHPSSVKENPDYKKENVNTTENVDNENAEIHMQSQTKKKKKFGSTRRPHGRQQPHAEGEDGEWKDPENTETEHQVITQAATSNLLTESHNTFSEVSLDIHDSNLTMEPKEKTIKSEVEIDTGKTDTQPAILSPKANQINTVVLDDVSSIKGLTDVNEQNEKPGDNEDEHAESALLNEQEITPMITELHDDAFAAVKEHVSESHDDEHVSEVNAYTTCGPVELIPQTHSMSDLQMNTENIHVIVPDQNLNISEEHLENPTNRETEPEQYESTSPFVQTQEPKSSQVGVIKENVEFSSSEKKRKMGSTRRSHRGPGIDQKNKFQELKEIENLQEQNMEQKDTNTGVTQGDNIDKMGKINADFTENVIKEDITPVSAQQNALSEVSSLTTDLGFTAIEHASSAGENPDLKEDNVNTTENVENKNAEIHTQTQTKKKKKFGSTRRPHGRQQPETEGEDGEWKDPENTETEQVITQAVSSNMLTDPHNTTSEVSLDNHDSTLTMEPKETIKSEVEIGTLVIDTSPAKLSPEANQINTVVLDDVSSVNGLTDVNEQNEKPGDNEDEHAESALLNEQEITPMITELHDDAFAAVKEHVSESHDDEHVSEVNAYTTCGPVELIPQTHSMLDLQMNTENIHVIVPDQNLNISDEYLENPTNKKPEQYESTSPFVQEDITPVSAQQNVLSEVSSLTTDLGFTTFEHPSSVKENPDYKEENVNTTENVDNENAEIHMQSQTKKKKKFGSTRRPQRRQQPHAEGEDGEWKDPENTETEHQVITQAATSNLLTESHNTISEVSLDIHDSNLTMEPKEKTIKSEVEIKTGRTDTQPAILSPKANQINTVVLDDVSSIKGLTDVNEQNEKPGDNEDEHAESALLNEQEITPMITELHDDAFAAVKEHVSESHDDEHVSEVNAYTTCGPVELIPQTHSMSDLQMNTENIRVIVSDQTLNISEEHLENPTNRETEPEQCESTSPFVQIQEPKSSQVGVIKENVEFSSSEKKRKMGSTRRSLRGPGIDQKNKFQELKEIENLQEQNMKQKDTNTGVTQGDNIDTMGKINADFTENVIKEDITPVSAQQNALSEVSSLTTDLGFTAIEHASSAGENPDLKEDNVNTTENVENKNAEIHTQTQTKKKKKFGSTRRPHGRQQPETEGEDGEWKDPENTETEHQVITQAVSLNMLTDPHNTTSEVSLDNHDSTLTMEPKETIKSKVEIRTLVIDTSPAILSPKANQINTVVLDDVSSVEGLTDVKDQNEKPADTDKHAESALLNEQEITPMVLELHNDSFAAMKEHVSESHDDEHVSEVNAYTTCGPVELIPQTHSMSDLQMNRENIHVIVSDQTLNISEEHLHNPTNRETEPEQYESTSPFVQTQEPKSSQVGLIKENVEFSSSEKKRKMGSTRRSLRGPGIDQKDKFQELKEIENLQEQNMEQKDTNTGVTQGDNNDTKNEKNDGLTQNVIKEDITPVTAQPDVLSEVSSLTTDLGFTAIEHASSAGENPDLKEDNVNITENVENKNAEIHTQTQTKKKKKFGSTRRPQRRQQPHAEVEDGEENAEEIKHHIITQAATSNLLTESQNPTSEVSLDIHGSPLTVEQNETIKSDVEIGNGMINTPPAILSPDADQINTVVLENLTNRELESEQNKSSSPFVQMQESKSSHVDVVKKIVKFSGSEKRRKMGSTRKSLREQIPESDPKNEFQEIEEKENIQEQNTDQKDTNTENTKEENNDKKEKTNAGLTKNVFKEDIPSVNAQQYVLCEVPSLTTDLGSTTIEHPSSATENENSIDYVKNEKAEIQTQIQAKKKKKFGSTRRAQGRLQPHETEGKLNDVEDTEEMHNSDLNFCDTKTRKQEYEPPIHSTLDQSECSLLSEIELYLNKSFESTLNTTGLNPNISEFSDPMSDGSLQLPSSQSSKIHMEQSSPSRRRKMGSSRKMTRNRHAEKICDESRESEQEKENLDNNPKSEEKTIKETVIAEGIEEMKQSVKLMPEVQALSQLNEHSTQATEPLPEVKRKFGSRRKVKGSSHLGAFTNGDNENKTEVTKDKLGVSDPFYMSEQESTHISHPDSEPRPGIEEVKEAVGKDTNASTKAGLVSLHTIRKTSPGVVNTGGRPKIDFDQWNEEIPDFEQAVYNVVMVGNSNVGKTSFIKRLQNGHFIPDYSATIGVDTFVQTVTFGSRTVKLYVWDTAGQERYHSITKQVFHKAQGLLLMYDITSSQSFQAVRAWISQIQENAPSDVILMLLGNKNDRTDRKVQLKEGEDLSKEYDIDFMECSAATGENVLESLKTLAWLLVKQRVRKEEEHTTLQPKPQNKKKSGCC